MTRRRSKEGVISNTSSGGSTQSINVFCWFFSRRSERLVSNSIKEAETKANKTNLFVFMFLSPRWSWTLTQHAHSFLLITRYWICYPTRQSIKFSPFLTRKPYSNSHIFNTAIVHEVQKIKRKWNKIIKSLKTHSVSTKKCDNTINIQRSKVDIRW